MNGKQAKMLNHMRATREQRKHWRTLGANKKGVLRDFYENNEKMIYFTYTGSLGRI
jgi:hypothetical protein